MISAVERLAQALAEAELPTIAFWSGRGLYLTTFEAERAGARSHSVRVTPEALLDTPAGIIALANAAARDTWRALDELRNAATATATGEPS